jgi:transcriptional regulator with XRE-family HTH domain
MNSVNKQLGDFLRLKRESLSPRDLGLPTSLRRRTPGLRREEVAELAGISVDWYMRLEQGRDSLPSKITAEALAKVLRLNATDRSHFLNLALGHSGRVFKKETVPTDVVKLVQGFSNPSYIMGARYDLLYWNPAAVNTFRDFAKIPVSQRNMLHVMFSSMEVRKRFVNWERDARDMLESFRASYDLWAHAPEFGELVETISLISPEFKKWWKGHVIRYKVSGEIVIRHEKWGIVKLPYSTFQLSACPDLRLVIYGQRTSSDV